MKKTIEISVYNNETEEWIDPDKVCFIYDKQVKPYVTDDGYKCFEKGWEVTAEEGGKYLPDVDVYIQI